MTLSRWKLVAGVVGLAVCGVAALAEPACRTLGITRRADDTKPAEAPKPSDSKPLPLPDVNPPAATEVPPVIPPVSDAKPLPLPVPVPEVKPVAPVPVAVPAVDPVFDAKKDPLLDIDVKGTKSILPAAKPDALKPAPVNVDAEPTPPPKPSQYTPPVLLPVKDEKLAPPVASVPPPVSPAPVSAEHRTNPFAGKKLKVMLHLSADKPWFEVRDGEEVVLKVTADAVDLKATADAADPTGGLKASGGVTFRTLGGNGACDELKVVPGTGEVIVTGKVSVTSNWGRTETTATAEKMTFRLGGERK